MNKRYVRIDIEYNIDINPLRLHSFAVLDNIKKILQEDMPYCRVVFTRDSPDEVGLDSPRVKS